MFRCNHLFCNNCIAELKSRYSGTQKCTCPLCRSAEKIPENKYQINIQNIAANELQSLLVLISGTTGGKVSSIIDGTDCSTAHILGQPKFTGLILSDSHVGIRHPVEYTIDQLDEKIERLQLRIHEQYAGCWSQDMLLDIITEMTQLNTARQRLKNFV